MNMDHFLEEVVVKRKQGLQNALYAFATVSMYVFAIIALFTLSTIFYAFDDSSLIILVVFGAAAVLLYLRKDRLRTEYEYTFTNGDMDFAMVFNNQKRKTLGTMKVKNVDAFGPVNSNAFRKYLGMPNLKRRNWFLNRDAELYFFYYQKEGNKNMIVLEPSEEMVGLIKKYLPRGIYVD